MGFGGNLSAQDATLVQQMLGQQSNLAQQQTANAASIAAEDSAVLAQFRQNLAQLTGQTPAQQKKSVNPGIMDYIKTSPAGLANKPAPTGIMGALG